MGYCTDGLTFNVLRAANLRRAEHFRNARGKVVSGDEWSLSQWMNAVLGELGEAANIVKKIERGDFAEGHELAGATERLADELADVQTYLDLIAHHAGINLGRATIRKWNEVSERVASPVRLDDDGSDYRLVKSTQP